MDSVCTLAKHPTQAIFGIDLEGNPLVKNICEGPHYLVGGQTGSGKSVFVNHLLISMMVHTTPDELQIIWIDPKKVEASAYIDLPFCPINPVTDMQDAYALIQYLAWLMDERYEVLSRFNMKKIDSLNEFVEAKPEEARLKGLEKMPYIVCIIDEYADMAMQVPDVEKGIIRLGQKARASGIHLIVATQRPSAELISPSLKANIPSRVGMKTADSVNSYILLDQDGCENLNGYGDCYVKDVTGDITRVQGPYISDGEIDKIFSYLREKYGRPNQIDYKSKVVELGLAEWVEDYDDSVPMEERHVKKAGRGRRGGMFG